MSRFFHIFCLLAIVMNVGSILPVESHESGTNILFCLDLTTGAPDWERSVVDELRSPLTFCERGLGIFSRDSGLVVEWFDPKSGERLGISNDRNPCPSNLGRLIDPSGRTPIASGQKRETGETNLYSIFVLDPAYSLRGDYIRGDRPEPEPEAPDDAPAISLRRGNFGPLLWRVRAQDLSIPRDRSYTHMSASLLNDCVVGYSNGIVFKLSNENGWMTSWIDVRRAAPPSGSIYFNHLEARLIEIGGGYLILTARGICLVDVNLEHVKWSYPLGKWATTSSKVVVTNTKLYGLRRSNPNSCVPPRLAVPSTTSQSR